MHKRAIRRNMAVQGRRIKTLLLMIRLAEMECRRRKCRATYNYKKESIPSCSRKLVVLTKATTSTRPVVFVHSRVENQPPR